MSMSHVGRLTFITIACIAYSATAQTPRIDPAGIEGAVLIGGSEITQAAADRFVELAGGAKAKIAVVNVSDQAASQKVMERLTDAGEPRLLALKDAKAALGECTGVWVTAKTGAGWEGDLKTHPLRDDLRALLKRSGIVATLGGSSDVVALDALGVLPPGLIDARPSSNKKASRLVGLVGFDIQPGAALLIQGRTLSSVGEGTVSLFLAASSTLPERVISLNGKSKADLTALRRAAFDRAHAFPPRQVEPPFVEKGTLVIVGGGGSPDGLYPKFIEYAGGKDKAVIAIFPTANEGTPKRESIATAFTKAGAKKATVLYGRTQAEVESKAFLDTLKEATALWFDGGRQWRFVDCYEKTKALPLMFDVLKRGGVVGGTSAGATIQGEYLARGGVFNNFDIRYEGYERGLGFLKGVAIDQHFTQRKRLPEMTQLMKVHPQYLGIGIDEATAIVVKGSTADVVGKGKVHFYDARRTFDKGEPDYDALSAGGRYDLKERKILTSEK